MKLDKHVKALKKNQTSAFEAIYHKTKHAVFAMAISIVKDRHLAEDVMQQSYMKMLEKLNTYNQEKAFMTWLLSITKHTSIDVIRHRNKEFPSEINPVDQPLFSLPDTPIENRLEAEYYLSLLAAEELQIVLLRIVGEQSFKDIAQLMQTPLGTVTWKYYEAIKKMRLAKGGNTDEETPH